MPDSVIEASAVVTVDAADRVLSPGWIHVHDGEIAAVGTGSAPASIEGQRLGGPDLVAIPGLVNAHTHIFQVVMRDLFDGLPFSDWLREIYHVGAAFDTDAWRASAALGAAEAALGGTTTLVDHEFFADDDACDALISGVLEVGMRLALARTAMDLGNLAPPTILEGAASGTAAVDRLLRRHRAEIDTGQLLILGGANTPGISASGELALATFRHARERGIGVSTHVAESRDIVDEVRRAYGVDGVVRWLDGLDALGPGMIAAHSVQLAADEVAIYARRGVAVSHNPVSNLYLGDGIAPVADMLDNGVVVAMGTDGATSNGTQDLFETMKATVLLSRIRGGSRWLTPAEAIRMATINGARALGIADRTGSIEVGKRADLALVATDHAPHAVGSHDPVAYLVLTARASDVRTVIANGSTIVEEGRLVQDQEAIVEGARIVARRVAEKAPSRAR